MISATITCSSGGLGKAPAAQKLRGNFHGNPNEVCKKVSTRCTDSTVVRSCLALARRDRKGFKSVKQTEGTPMALRLILIWLLAVVSFQTPKAQQREKP